MDFEQEQQLVTEIKRYVSENLPLSKMSDEELEEKVEEIVTQRIGVRYCSIDQKISIIQQAYSSIRGFGLLDSIISDDTITEVMINGPENVFIGSFATSISNLSLATSTSIFGNYNNRRLQTEDIDIDVVATYMNCKPYEVKKYLEQSSILLIQSIITDIVKQI